MPQKVAVIIGAGPAGLTAARELLRRTDILPIVLEKTKQVGGLARTVSYKGNKIDIGGHRFFSKSDHIMSWWLEYLPMQALTDLQQERITYQGSSRNIHVPHNGPNPDLEDRVMLLRKRKSRIYFKKHLFDYPLNLSWKTLSQLGVISTYKIMLSYLRVVIAPLKSENSLEEFFINRFGKELYTTFFKSYTEKIWGVPCKLISPEWGVQRIKGLSMFKAITHAFTNTLRRITGLSSKHVETSLIEQFLYPKYGAGQLWNLVADDILNLGGKILINQRIEEIIVEDGWILGVKTKNSLDGQETVIKADYLLSSMPIQDLVRIMHVYVPPNVAKVSEGLIYRNLVVIGLLMKKLKLSPSKGRHISDNWIYVHEPDVRVGRIQIYNNWSPYMVQDQNKVWLGVEYFCSENEELWNLSDKSIVELGIEELSKISIIDKSDVLDSTVIKVPKAYPAYFGTYEYFDELQFFLDGYKNLFPIGRNGMHKYNNQDHAMLTAMAAVSNIVEGRTDKQNIWEVNTEATYLEAQS